MDISLFLAKLIGIYSIVVALGFMLNPKRYSPLVESFFKEPILVYLAGILALLIGLTIVLIHNIWTTDWRVIITIFGWLSLIKGIFLILFPHLGELLLRRFKESLEVLILSMFILLVLGIFLIIKGFFT